MVTLKHGYLTDSFNDEFKGKKALSSQSHYKTLQYVYNFIYTYISEKKIFHLKISLLPK